MASFRGAGGAAAAAPLLLLLALAPSGSTGLRRRHADQHQDVHTISLDESDASYPMPNVRSRRDAAGQSSLTASAVSNLTTAFHLNNSHLHLMVHWAGRGSDVMFCLARDQKMAKGATSRLYMSTDYGTTFRDESDKFKLADGRNAVIAKFYHHPKSNCHYVFADTLNRYLFTSTDCGHSVEAHPLEMAPESVEFDSAHDRIFLVHDRQDTESKLYVTRNFGQTFSHVQDYVKKFYFLHGDGDDDTEETTLFVQRMEPGSNLSTILASKNYFERQVDTEVLYSGAKEFEVFGRLLFVTKPADADADTADTDAASPGHQLLFVSAAGSGPRFVPATFSVHRDSQVNLGYYIVDVTPDNQLLVVVNHNSTLSNLYASTRLTPHQAEFSLSMERVMYYNPDVTWKDSWLNDAAGGEEAFADVYKINGLRGIYIASQIRSTSLSHGQIQPDDLVSLITFDQGGMWAPIKGPETDEEGHPYPDCAPKAAGGDVGGHGGHGGHGHDRKCSLHLTQQLSKRFPSTRAVPIKSSESAVGIVVGTGNMGHSLNHRSNVFLSADAGLSWHQVLKGFHYFNVGDHGGVVVAVKYYKTEGWTNELLYSTNEGVDWKTVVFYKEPLRVFGLLTEPGENTTVFTMFGTAKSKAGVDWIIVKVNLTSVFDHPCTEDDYKRWSPSDNSLGKHRNCILGRKEVYERRIVNVNCYSGRDYQRRITVENCGCDRADFLCDFGFRKDDAWTDACVREDKDGDASSALDIYGPPSNCPAGQKYNRTRGYIKLRGDTCQGGRESHYAPLPVACPVAEERDFLLVSQRTAIVRVNLRQDNEVTRLPLANVNNVITLEFDLEENCVMYGDIELDKIFMQCLNGSEPRVLVENDLMSVEGMAYDWINKALYFADGVKRMIELVRVDLRHEGRMRKTILDRKALVKPRGLAVHPLHGYLFYTDWNEKKPHIGRANMDGSERQILFSKPLMLWPNGLSIDYLANRVYWVDAQKDFIASCDLDGQNFKKVLGGVPELVHPFAVGVHKELMYWDDWNTKSLFYANKNSGQKPRTLLTNMNGAMDLKIFSSSHRTGTHACSSSPCSHLCVPMPPPTNFVCMCPDGMKADKDSLNCLCPGDQLPDPVTGNCPKSANGTCADPDMFPCANNFCIPHAWRCDLDDDCGDRSDEIDCIRDRCRDFQFRCDNRKCVPDYWKCDFDDDCGDGSDERDCKQASCNKEQFLCDNGQCISRKWVCDMEKDCQDGSDERNCTTMAPTCKPDEVQCPKSGICIPKNWMCDGESDCPDDDFDEQNCGDQTCKDWQFRCANGHCIFQTWRCDNETDCPDNSDEKDCPAVTDQPALPVPVFPKGKCNEWMFKCADELCIPFWWKCDGTKDCEGGEDEEECDVSGGPAGRPSSPVPPVGPSDEPGSGKGKGKKTVCDEFVDWLKKILRESGLELVSKKED